jgi:hypothetical protein
MLRNFIQEILQMSKRRAAPTALALASLLVLGSLDANASLIRFRAAPNIGAKANDALSAINNDGLDHIDLNAPPTRLVGFNFAGAAANGAGGTDCVGIIDANCIALRVGLPGITLPGSENDGSVEFSSS